MRHRKSGRHFNRTRSHQKAMIQNLMISLIEHEVMRTTLMRAKEMRRYIEPIITFAKEDILANRRLVFSRLRNKKAVKKLFTVIGPASKKRPGGYLRILKCGFRHSDNAPMSIVELVDREKFEKTAPEKSEKPAKSSKKTSKEKQKVKKD